MTGTQTTDPRGKSGMLRAAAHTTARSVAQTLRRNGFLGAHATSRALGLLPGQCYVWFEWGSATAAADLLRGRGWRCKRSGRGLVVEDAAEQAARGGRGAAS